MDRDNQKLKFDRHDLIVWIIAVTIVWYVFGFSLVGEILFSNSFAPFHGLMQKIHYMPDANRFAITMYLATLPAFIGAFLYTGIPKRNRFIFRTFLPSHPGNTAGILLLGLAVGFLMNFACILCALIHGDIKLFLNFGLSQIPFYLFALVCVFVQSSAEELWTRGFMYERINVRYPLWVAILVNGVFFGFLHIFNDGVGFLPILDICICGVSFSLAKWYTGSIWFPMGIHTAWNFTQNFLFGLPNSGLVSEASVFGMDAASATDSVVYNVAFGVEGAVPAVLADAVLGIACLVLAARKGRLGELTQKVGRPPDLPDPSELADGQSRWVYREDAEPEQTGREEIR